MKAILLAGASTLLVACSAGDDPGGNVEPAEADSAMAADQSEMANETMDEEAMDGRSIDGRWGIQYEACSEDNVSGDGVIVISRYDIIMGMDACSIAGVTETDGVYQINGMCEGMDGAYEQTFHFSTPQDGVLRWDNREFDRVEDYVICGDGGMD
ncbi:hypothetical protein [Hyphobacterium sp.]|uniref:hypothetical protein n=1 Tax=Hyphobacterium sp. TaxID=2004662 RepID=UPI00374A92C3